jgi:hypothetical protein
MFLNGIPHIIPPLSLVHNDDVYSQIIAVAKLFFIKKFPTDQKYKIIKKDGIRLRGQG